MQLESSRLDLIRLREESTASHNSISDLCTKLEQRAIKAEGEAALSITSERENRMRWLMDRQSIATRMIYNVHRLRRVRQLKRGVMRWKSLMKSEKMREEYTKREQTLVRNIRIDHEAAMALASNIAEEKFTAQQRILERTSISRDLLAEERSEFLLAAKGLGPVGVMLRWRAGALKAKVRYEII